MSVIYPLTLPINRAVESSFHLDRNESDTQSPFTRLPQTTNVGGGTLDLWTGYFQTENLNIRSTQRWNGFFDALRGTIGTFTISNPDYKGPASGALTSNPTVDGPGQSGLVLNIKGLPSNIVDVLQMGDEFTVNDEYKRLTSDADSSASGRTIISFEPVLRASPADGAVVNFLTPSIIARLEQPHDQIRTNHIATPVAFSWIEAV